jgi:hypothetical protein
MTPPLIEQLHVSQRHFQLVLSVSDPEVIKHELLTCYAYLSNHLVRLLDPAQCITRDLTKDLGHTPEFYREIEAQVDSFADSLQNIVRQVHFICYLFQRLPEDTLDQVAVQEQHCALDILWHQLDGLFQTVSMYHTRGFPNRWFTALTTSIGQLAVQVNKWYYQLQIDLAHLNQPDPMASVAQESSIPTRTQSHYFGSPSYRPWTSR